MLAGTVGSEARLDYTAIGEPVNIASWLCQSAEPGQVLITGNADAAVYPTGMCSTTPMGTGKSAGRAPSRRSRACGPPVEVPMSTSSHRFFARDRLLGAGFGLVRGGVLLLAVATAVALTPAAKSPPWQASHGARWLEIARHGLTPLLPAEVARRFPA